MAALFRALIYISTVMVLKRNPPHIPVNLNTWFPVGTTVYRTFKPWSQGWGFIASLYFLLAVCVVEM